MGPPLINIQGATSQLALVEAGSSAALGGLASYVMPRAIKEAEGPAKSKSQRALKDAMYSGAAALVNNATTLAYYLPDMSMSPVPAKAVSEGAIFAGISMFRGPKQRTLRSALMNFAVGTVVASVSQKIVVPYMAPYVTNAGDVVASGAVVSSSVPNTPARTGTPGFASS